VSGSTATGERHARKELGDIRVVIVDDHDLFRTGLKNLLEEQGVQVIGEAANGRDALRLVSELAPDVVIMDLNMPGISGVAGIIAAAAGESLISPQIASKVLQRLRSQTSHVDAAETIRAELSDREIEVLKLIANGKDNAQIAGELFISPKTVKNHISNILMKLQIDNRIQAAVYAVRSGIV
jgi:DNA-binding NarL/FixJ family response regulator